MTALQIILTAIAVLFVVAAIVTNRRTRRRLRQTRQIRADTDRVNAKTLEIIEDNNRRLVALIKEAVVSVSPELVMPRADVHKSSMQPPSGAELTWEATKDEEPET